MITKKFNSKIAGLIIFAILFSSFSTLFPQKAEAQWVVWDPGNFVPNTFTAVNTGISAAANVDTAINTTLAGPVKEFGLDAVAWIIVNLIIERMAASTVNWINSGFKGSPSFLTNPEEYFKDMGDKIAGQFIFSNPNLKFLCGPIQAKIRLALSKNYVGDNRQWNCTLTQVGKNMEDFMGDFEKGGWNSFLEISQNTTMNPIGAYIKAENQLNIEIANKQVLKDKELNMGKGFLSYKSCARYSSSGSSSGGSYGDESGGGQEEPYVERDESGAPVGDTSVDISQYKVPECLEERVNTPGSVISEQLNKTLGIGGEKLAVADELNEIVSALLNQLVGKIVGGIGKGLRALSKPDTAKQNQVFTSQILERGAGSTIVDYFCVTDPTDPNYNPNIPCNTPNTAAKDLPLPTPEGYEAAGNSNDLDSRAPALDFPTNPVY